MKKDKQWLRDRYESMETIKVTTKNSRGKRSTSYLKKKTVINLLNQLDKPETLSEEWLDENKSSWTKLKIDGYYIPVEKLQNLLVPKQELPVIPKFVAEYLDFAKSDTTLMRVLELANTRNELEIWEKEYDWISANDETFAKAWLDGFTVEEEQRYYVLGKHDTPILFRDYRNRITETSNLSDIYPKANSEDFEFTEQEIKDYDPRYMSFAVKVEELEE